MVEGQSSTNSFAAKAELLKLKADKTLQGSFFGNLMKNKASRMDEARDLYK